MVLQIGGRVLILVTVMGSVTGHSGQKEQYTNETTPSEPTVSSLQSSGSGNGNGNWFIDCLDARQKGHTQSTTYTINPASDVPFTVQCDMETDEGGWTVFHKSHTNTSAYQYTWYDYVYGFKVDGNDFWIGLEKLHWLTAARQLTQMRIDVTDLTNNTVKSTQFDEFFIDSWERNYEPHMRNFHDIDDTANDNNDEGISLGVDPSVNELNSEDECAMENVGGWWFKRCTKADEVERDSENTETATELPKMVQMMIRAIV